MRDGLSNSLSEALFKLEMHRMRAKWVLEDLHTTGAMVGEVHIRWEWEVCKYGGYSLIGRAT
jgi:hypothetical protein